MNYLIKRTYQVSAGNKNEAFAKLRGNEKYYWIATEINEIVAQRKIKRRFHLPGQELGRVLGKQIEMLVYGTGMKRRRK